MLKWIITFGCCVGTLSTMLRASSDLSVAAEQCVGASLAGDVSTVRQLLERYGDRLAGISDSNGLTPLMAASFGGSKAYVRTLTSGGQNAEQLQDVNSESLSGRKRQQCQAIAQIVSSDPLWKYGQVVELLASRGADVNDVGKQQCTPLYIAAQAGHASIVRLLLSIGAHPNQLGSHGVSPVTIASRYGYEPVVRVLLEQNALLDVGAIPALHAACSGGHAVMVQVLAKAGAKINQQRSNGNSALIDAVIAGHAKTVACLLDLGADCDISERHGVTPVMVAALQGHDEVLEHLLRAGASVDARCNAPGHSALTYACLHGRDSTAQQLIAYGATIDHRSFDGFTPLMAAARSGNDQLVCMLLVEGANVSATVRNNGLSALHCAAQNDHVRVIELLAAAGADIEQNSYCNTTALCSAVYRLHASGIEALLSLGANPDVRVEEKSLLDVLLSNREAGGENEQIDEQELQGKRQRIARLLFERGFSQYTQEQLDTLGISLAEAEGFVKRLHSAFESGCEAQVAGIGRYTHFPPELRQLVGSFVGGSIGQVR